MKNKIFSLLILSLIFWSAGTMICGQTVEVLIKNAEAAIERADYETALKIISRVLAKQPASADALTQRARVNFFKGNDREAVADADRALAANPSSAADYVVRGAAKRKLRIAPDDVLRDLNRAIEIEPKNSKAWFNRGMLFWDVGKTDNALADLNRAIELAPNTADYYYSRGSLYQSLKNSSRAIEDFSKNIELAPNNADGYANRAGNYFDEVAGTSKDINDLRIASARADTEKALNLDAKNWNALKIRALIKYYLKDNAGALTDFIASYKINPNRPETVNWLVNDQNWRAAPADLQAELLKTQSEIYGVRLAKVKAEFEKDYTSVESYDRLYDAFRIPEKVKKTNPAAFEIREYFKAMLVKEPQNICLILWERHTYNDRDSDYLKYNYTFVRALERSFEKKDSRCAAEMAKDISAYHLKYIEQEDGQRYGEKFENALKWAKKSNEFVPGYARNTLRIIGESIKRKTEKDINMLVERAENNEARRRYANDYEEKRQKLIAAGAEGITSINVSNIYASSSGYDGAQTSVNQTKSAEENALISEYNSLIGRISDLERQQRGLERKVADYMNAAAVARIFMYRNLYNSCNNIIDSHQAFITSLEKLRSRAADKSPAVVSQIDRQVSSVKSTVDKLFRIRREIPIGQ